MGDFWSKLAEPFPAHAVEWRPGATTRDGKRCLALAYLTARAVMDRLDAVCTPAGWRHELRPVERSKAWICRIEVRDPDDMERWVWHEDAADETDIEGTKGAASSAFKRAAVHFGIGRYLYDLDSPWVDYNAEKKRIVATPSLPKWALPGGSGHPPAGAQDAKPDREQAKRDKSIATNDMDTDPPDWASIEEQRLAFNRFCKQPHGIKTEELLKLKGARTWEDIGKKGDDGRRALKASIDFMSAWCAEHEAEADREPDGKVAQQWERANKLVNRARIVQNVVWGFDGDAFDKGGAPRWAERRRRAARA